MKDGEAGFLVPFKDPAATVEPIEHLLTDGSSRRRMGEAAREHVCQTFSSEMVGARLLEIYRWFYPELLGV